jgi:phage terminase large subunit GpA-like protein
VKPPGRRNEALDCAVYALAAAHWLHMDRWREGDWAKWEQRVAVRDLFDAPAELAAQAEPEVAPEDDEPQPTPPPPPANRRMRRIGKLR